MRLNGMAVRTTPLWPYYFYVVRNFVSMFHPFEQQNKQGDTFQAENTPSDRESKEAGRRISISLENLSHV